MKVPTKVPKKVPTKEPTANEGANEHMSPVVPLNLFDKGRHARSSSSRHFYPGEG